MPDHHLSEDSVIRSAGISTGWRQSRHVSESRNSGAGWETPAVWRGFAWLRVTPNYLRFCFTSGGPGWTRARSRFARAQAL